MSDDKGGFDPNSRLGCASVVGGGFNKSLDRVGASIVPFRLLALRVLEMSEGEWIEL
jgi:hypothetical protein